MRRKYTKELLCTAAEVGDEANKNSEVKINLVVQCRGKPPMFSLPHALSFSHFGSVSVIYCDHC